MRLPSQIVKMMEIMPPSSHPMDVLRTAVSALSYFDPECDDNSPASNRRKAIRLIAQIPTIVAHLFRIRQGKSILSPDPHTNMAANILYMFHGKMPSNDHIRAMDQLLLLHADHGMNASTFAARVTASTHADMYAAVTSAIGTLKGPLHGGANERVMKMLQEINNVDEVEEYVESMLAQGLRVMGFGHRVYKKEDPRARHLRKSSELLCAEFSADKNFFVISHRIEDIVLEKKGIYPNVDFYSATVQHALGIPEEFYTAIFAASRISGWTAHVLDQYANNRLIRPTSKYIGQFNRPFVPIELRSAEC
ncbi:MAG: citrate/2-methylcitrate synthase, partial [Candidatus Latescibacterota bacterium]